MVLPGRTYLEAGDFTSLDRAIRQDPLRSKRRRHASSGTSRAVPEQCPDCGSPHLSPEEGWREDLPEIAWERPVCEDCGWAGQPIPVVVRSDDKVDKIITRVGHNDEEHVIPTVPLMRLDRPGDT